MGGGFFDNMWDPYSRAYAYPRAQPRAPRTPVRAPEVGSPSKVEAPLQKKPVRTIPVTDGAGAPVAVVSQVDVKAVVEKLESEGAVDLAPVVGKLRSEDGAATKIQAVYRGYLVRKTQPVKQLRVIEKVKEELEGFKRRLDEPEQKEKLRSDAQERLRWTEGIMALLLRLDTLQGVHPEVRLVRKAVTKELIQFQEMIDLMSAVSGRLDGNDDVVDTSDVVEEGAKINNVGTDVPTVVGVEENSAGQSVKATEDSTSDKPVPQVHSDIHDQVVGSHGRNFRDESGPLPESIVEEVGFVSEPVSTETEGEVPMDVEKKEQILTTVSTTEEVEVEPASSHIELPRTDAESDNHEPLGVDDSATTEPSRDVIYEPISEEDASVGPATEINVEEMWDEAHHVGRREEAARLTEEAERPVLQDTPPPNGENCVSGRNSDTSDARLEKRETTSGFTDQGNGQMIPAVFTRAMSLDTQCIDSLQVSQPSTADDINALSDRALLLQLVEENRKLKDVVGKVLHWGKHQNDVIHNLAARIRQLEEHHPQLNLLEDEENKGRKTKDNDVSSVGGGGRPLQRSEKGRKKGKSGNRPQLGNFIDSEDWPSAESDEYF